MPQTGWTMTCCRAFAVRGGGARSQPTKCGNESVHHQSSPRQDFAPIFDGDFSKVTEQSIRNPALHAEQEDSKADEDEDKDT
jgi:hypothetical protein